MWNERFAENPDHFGAGPNELLEKYAADLSPGTAIDVGAGQGRNTVWLLKRGWEVTAVDFSDVALEHTQQAAERAGVANTLTTLERDLEMWQPTEKYDLVLSAYIHLQADLMRSVWQQLVNATAPGGTLMVIGHHRENQGHGPTDPNVLFTAAEVRRILPSGWTVQVEEAVDRGEGTLDALLIATAPEQPHD